MSRMVMIAADELDGIRRRLREAEEEIVEWRALGDEGLEELKVEARHDRGQLRRAMIADVVAATVVSEGAELTDLWGATLGVQPQKAAALVVLLGARGQTVTVEYLVFSARAYQVARHGAVTNPKGLAANLVSVLRSALAPHGLGDCIQTRPGRGYQITKQAANRLNAWLAGRADG